MCTLMVPRNIFDSHVLFLLLPLNLLFISFIRRIISPSIKLCRRDRIILCLLFGSSLFLAHLEHCLTTTCIYAKQLSQKFHVP